MLKSERKKIVFKEFDLYFNPLGYKGIKTGGDPTYVLKTKDFVVTFFMNFLDVGGIDIYNRQNEMSKISKRNVQKKEKRPS